MFRLPVDGGDAGGVLEEIDLGAIAEINNDHVISPDGGTAYVSIEDGHIYAVDHAGSRRALAGTAPRRVTNDNGPNFKHYLHGMCPDGTRIAIVAYPLSAFWQPDGTAVLAGYGNVPSVMVVVDVLPSR